ncbi:MAG TPA: peptide-methionine (S)-S-oxide reductase MsrA [Kofleriaceae bacterium]|nr:peptide-methionine (S)-S-oxide reductase MsrA [Kofleriaceae bacterium]
MTKPIALVTLLVLAVGCGADQASANTSDSAENAAGVAYFAGGCFWGVEHFMEAIDGVVSVESGYMGGDVMSPSYEQVSHKNTGHLETVRVRFDPAKVSYEKLARRFFEIHDPTQANGQGPDIGAQYHSAIFYSSPTQKQIADKLIAKLVALGYDVVTEVRPAGRFWKAEDYHQNYYARTGKQPYCHIPVSRFAHGPTH